MGYNWTLNENGNIVFPIPEAVKTPWFRSTGEIPHTCEYFNGTMYEKIEETAKKHPLNIAMDFMGKHITYKYMIDQINLCAKSLRILGIRENDRVTIAMPNCPQAIYMLYATNLVGAVANMIHPLSAEKEIENYLNMSGSVMVVTLDQFYHKIEAIRHNTKIQNVIIARIRDELTRPIRVGYMLTEGRKIQKIPKEAPVFQWPDFMSLGRHCGYEYRVKRHPDDPAAILYSGGTTGTTKGIVLTNLNFNALGLKKLITTCYATSPITYTQLSLFEEEEISYSVGEGKKPYKIEITEVTDVNGDSTVDLSDVEYLLKNKKNALTLLNEDGDFRSSECIALLDECDIVVTNPPFSLMKEYIPLLMRKNKEFIILGNVNHITLSEIKPFVLR